MKGKFIIIIIIMKSLPFFISLNTRFCFKVAVPNYFQSIILSKLINFE